MSQLSELINILKLQTPKVIRCTGDARLWSVQEIEAGEVSASHKNDLQARYTSSRPWPRNASKRKQNGKVVWKLPSVNKSRLNEGGCFFPTWWRDTVAFSVLSLSNPWRFLEELRAGKNEMDGTEGDAAEPSVSLRLELRARRGVRANPDSLLPAIRAVLNGKHYCNSELWSHMPHVHPWPRGHVICFTEEEWVRMRYLVTSASQRGIWINARFAGVSWSLSDETVPSLSRCSQAQHCALLPLFATFYSRPRAIHWTI